MDRHLGMRVRDWGILLVLSVLWGGSFFFAKIALRGVPPLTLVFCRVALAAVALGLYLRLRGMAFPRAPGIWLAFFGMGLLNNLIPFTLLFWGQTEIAGGLASILNATTPIFSLIAAHLLTADEKLSIAKLGGILLGFAGVAVLIGGGLMAQHGPSLLPMFACLGAAFSYGIAGVFGRRFRRMGVPPVLGAFGQTTASACMSLPLVLLVDAPWHMALPGEGTILAILGLAVLSTALAYILFFHILAVGGAVNSSLVTLLIPVSACLLGRVFLGEDLAANECAGMALIALGLLGIDGRIFRLFRRAASA
ncbi:DMT family transporter [Acidisoma sp. C75]